MFYIRTSGISRKYFRVTVSRFIVVRRSLVIYMYIDGGEGEKPEKRRRTDLN